MEEKKPKKKKTFIDYMLTVILVVAIGVFCYAGYNLFTIYTEYKEGTDEYDEIAQMAVTVRETDEEIDKYETAETSVSSDSETGSENQKEKLETVNEMEVTGEENELAEVSAAVTREQLAEQVVKLLGEIASTEWQVYQKQGTELQDENTIESEEYVDTTSAIDSGNVRVLTKPNKTDDEEKIEAAENAGDADNIETADKTEATDKIENAEKIQDVDKLEIVDSTVEKKAENGQSQEDAVENLQSLIREISSILKERKLFEDLLGKSNEFPFIPDPVKDVVSFTGSPAAFSVKKLTDSISAVTSGLKLAVEIRENGPGIEAPLQVDFEVLQGINDDVIGWLYIEAIDSINYPVVQGEDNDEYLHHTYEGKYNFAGTIFIDYENSRDFSDNNTIVYGHNMKNGSMFGQLRTFVSKQETYEKSKYFWILTPDADYRYEIIAAYTTGVKSDTYTLFNNPGKNFLNYIDKIRGWSAIETSERKFTVRDKIVTLSTCTGNESTRFVVQGVRVNTISK